MENNIYQLLMHQSQIMDLIETQSQHILQYAINKNADELESSSQNRFRLINIIDHLNSKIDNSLKSINNLESCTNLLEILKTWSIELDIWTQKINKIDVSIMEEVNIFKTETCKEIGTTYKSKNQLQGYDLSSVKK